MATGAEIEGAAGRKTSSLIASDKVEGTPVRRPNGETLGTIDKLVIEKASGRVVYAVMSFGGFLGMAEHHYTIPWSKLRYDTGLDAYQLDLSDDEIRGAPGRARHPSGTSEDPSFDPEWEDHVRRYFNAEPHRGEPIDSATHEAQR